MSVLPSVQIPMIERQKSNREASSFLSTSLTKLVPIKQLHIPHGPLPIRPSTSAPRNARILARQSDHGGKYTYKLMIGDILLEKVGIEEVLEYVSPYELELFENAQFEEERRVLDALEEKRIQNEAERKSLVRQRARMKGIERFENISVSENDTSDVQGAQSIKRGRARPSYKHLFRLPKQRPRRRRLPVASTDLVSLSDEDELDDQALTSESSSDEKGHAGSLNVGAPSQHVRQMRGPREPTSAGIEDIEPELPKRRRRKRGSMAGELLPFEVVIPTTSKENQPQRRRRPVTGEMIPLRRRFDPDADYSADAKPMRRAADSSMPPMNRLSLSRDHTAKRIKLDPSFVTRSSSASTATSTETQDSDQAPPQRSASELKESDGSALEAESIEVKQPQPIHRSVGGTTIRSGDEESVSSAIEQIQQSASEVSLLPTEQQQTKSTPLSHVAGLASPMNKFNEVEHSPTAAAARLLQLAKQESNRSSDESDMESADLPQHQSVHNSNAKQPATVHPDTDTGDEDESSDASLDGEEFIIEAVLEHHLSDPRTHPPELGKTPVMLYRVKWEGVLEPTWEPRSSFIDESVVEEYEASAGFA